MNTQAHWTEVNDNFLAANLAWIRLLLQQAATPLAVASDATSEAKKGGRSSRNKDTENGAPPASPPNESTAKLLQARRLITQLTNNDPPPALVLLANRLGLSEFDCNTLALCAGAALDTQIATLCAQAQADPGKPYPTFALAFSLFDDPDWGAMSPHAALRHWRLLEINQAPAQAIAGAALTADERIVNYLKGMNHLDNRLTPLLDPIRLNGLKRQTSDRTLPLSQQRVVNDIITCFTHSDDPGRMPFVELLGHEPDIKREIAGRVASALGLSLYGIDIKSLPAQMTDFETFSRLWKRECLLMPLALYIDTQGPGNPEETQLKRFLEQNTGLVFLDMEDAKVTTARQRFSVEVNKPTPDEQQQLWKELLKDSESGQAKHLAEQFSFTHSEINRLANSDLGEVRESGSPSGEQPTGSRDLWQACRIAARAGMEKLARRIDAKASWEQLVLQTEQKELLHQITDQVSCRSMVYENWGFRNQMNRGLGINALFAGESGVGKTMAAEVIANTLRLDLYSIDLSAVVSKYIGETEKNLRKLFDAAEDSGAILFFDEADALFGKRSEVKDSHDRYANIEVNYLLQRMESYRGLAILATNMKSTLDRAFVRRLRFIVDFPFPDVEARAEIWKKVFPPDTPVAGDLDYQRLARLSLTGGNIHNIAINAAFLAAQKNSPVSMPLLLDAARTEFRKLERPAKDTDFAWSTGLEAVS